VPDKPPDSLHALVLDYLERQRAVITRGDVALRHGEEPIHRTRVAIRRYRSVLRVFAEEFIPEQASALEAELSWYGTVLGPVRDLHVLRRHLERALSELPDGVDVAAAERAINARLDADEAASRVTLNAALAGTRYENLLATLDDWHADPPFGRPDRRATEVVQYVDAAERTLSRRLRRAPRAENPDEAFHRARKAGKRARYAAELSKPALGPAAQRRVASAKRLQADLGDVQDSVIAQEFLQVLASDPSTEAAAGFALGLLWAHEQWRQEKALHHVG
jgi:CHAD domain-containing protein